MQKLVITLYRISALLIISAPIAFNSLLSGSILNSLIYTPLFSLMLASLTIYLDTKLKASLNCLSTKSQMKPNQCPDINFLLKQDLKHGC
jgi:hypothetical protein